MVARVIVAGRGSIRTVEPLTEVIETSDEVLIQHGDSKVPSGNNRKVHLDAPYTAEWFRENVRPDTDSFVDIKYPDVYDPYIRNNYLHSFNA